MTELERVGLGGNDKLSILRFSSEEDWLVLRQKGIGGSDAGAIMGLNKYTSPLAVYKAKVDGTAPDLSDNPNVRRGKELEDFVLTKYVQPRLDRFGYTTEKPDFMILNSDYPFLRANLDGIACLKSDPRVGTSILIEIKCVSMFAEDAWNGPDYGGIPPYYYAQIQHYLTVTGMNKAYLVALFDRTWTVKWYPIKRDQKFINEMLPILKHFYDYHMCMRMPPKITYSIDKEDAAEAISTAPKPHIPNQMMTLIVEKYRDVSANLKSLEKEKDELVSTILDMYLQGYMPTEGTVKFTTVKSKKFNVTKFKEANPGLYEQYCEDVETSRTTIK